MDQNSINFAYIPFNFTQLEEINKQTGDVNTSLLYALINFQTKHSKLSTHGTQTIARSRDQLADFLGLSLSKIDKIIKELEDLNLIKKTVSTWFCKKRLFISTREEAPEINVHFKKLFFLNKYTGDSKASLLFSRVAFGLNKTIIKHDAKNWCSLKREVISQLLCISLRSVDNIISKLIKKGLIIVKNFIWKGKRQLHFTIPEQWHKKITSDLKEMIDDGNIKSNDSSSIFKPNVLNCKGEPAKTKRSTRLNTNIQCNNNTNLAKKDEKGKIKDIQSDINLNKLNASLTKRQIAFLLAAFKTTIKRAQLTISNEEEVLEELKFSILNPEQRKGVATFTHAVSRCMQLLRQRTWRTPKGFVRYSPYGAELNAYRERQLQAHEVRKSDECRVDSAFLLNKEGYTEKAIQWAQHISNFVKQLSFGRDDSLTRKIDYATEKLIDLFYLGADKEVVKAYLPKEW